MGAVVVNWNTRELLARVLYGLRNVVTPGTIREIVVVDNGSDDGSAEFAADLAEAGVLRLIANEVQRYHGPGLTQGVNLLAELAEDSPVDLVWVLDSDVLFLRSEVLSHAATALAASGAVFAGERADYQPGAATVTTDRLSICSGLFDPAVVWQPAHSPFREDGEPSRHMQVDLQAAGHRLLAFPFCTERYLLHLGRQTLAEVAKRHDEDNLYLGWAHDHNEPHYGSLRDGQDLAGHFEARFRLELGDGRCAASLLADLMRER